MAELLEEVMVSLPQCQERSPPESDPEREVMMAAAAHLEHHRREREELKHQLAAAQTELQKQMMAAQVLLQAKDVKIEEAELALATERQRVAIYQDERDQAIGARCQAEADLRATEQLYGELLARLERFRLPANEIKRKGNGNGNGKHRVDAIASIVPDGIGASEAMSDESRSASAL
jgi:chromosome segregation ATPase